MQPILYHYTSPTGALGILASGSVWATNIFFLNDATELTHAADVANAVLQTLSEQERDSERRSLLKMLQQNPSPDKMWLPPWEHPYVFSLSEDGDLLSQWRAYSRDGGYAIGFHSGGLAEIGFDPGVTDTIEASRDWRIFLTKCVYDEAEQRERVREIIAQIVDDALGILRSGTDPGMTWDVGAWASARANDTFRTMLANIAPTLKHSTFREEREWRLVAIAVDGARPTIAWRASGSILIPYAPLPFGPVENFIAEVHVGPSSQMEFAESSISFLLKSRSRGQFQGRVAPSRIPYRGM
ncbi:MAG: DUF2971 domain-containing protein [Candidatus Rokubacteria bacterium]|nr:DUF2971 domain-containing protein [Candidatus Rokubacteria bacterium]